MSEHEQVIASGIINPADISVGFGDIGGLESIIDQLREAVIFPLVYPKLFNSGTDLYNSPKGVLLYGPPGCGKTMMAKALAKESGATFINLPVSTLTDKWFGESNKLVAATFSLARKLQPAVIFIDEIDALMRERSRNDHEVTTMMKSEFMSLWDGLTTGSDSRVMVLGATNRPTDIDAAIMRRMPKRFAVGLPDATQRRKILSLVRTPRGAIPTLLLDADVRHPNRCSKTYRESRALTSRRLYARLRAFQGAISRRRPATRPWCPSASSTEDTRSTASWTMCLKATSKQDRSRWPTSLGTKGRSTATSAQTRPCLLSTENTPTHEQSR